MLNVIVIAMRLTKQMLYFVVAVTVTSLHFCNGKALNSEAVVENPSAPGSVQLRSVKHDSVAPARRGSLTFKFNEQSAPKSPRVLHNLMDAKLRHIDPSVQCSDTSMTLKVKRVRAPHFLVDSGEGPLIPFSQMPSKCGFLVKRSRRDVHFAAPYHGCHVTQQGGNYVLPLHLWGAPVTMSCPAASPPPSVACFPSGMVVKIGGITANELQVKVSGMWESLSSVCSSCGFAVEVLSGGLKLTVPYNRGLCVEIEGEKYLLSLLLADVELLATCPSLLENPTGTTTSPPSDSGQVQMYPQYPQYPQFPMFPQYPVFPGPTPSTHIPAPTTVTVAPLPQNTQLPSGAENQEAPASQHPAFPFMAQYPQYPLFLRPVPPTRATPNENTAAPPGQFLQMQHLPQYQFPFYPQFPMVPGIFQPTTPPSTTPAPTTKHDGKPHVPQQSYFPLFPQYPFLPFPKLPLPQEDQTQSFQDHKPVIQKPKPYNVYPQTYQIPILYPPQKYLFQRRNTQTAAPATTSTTIAATTPKPADQKPIYYPHLYMPSYYVPQQAPMSLFPDPPSMPPANPAPSNQHDQQHVYHAMPPFYHFPSHQRPNLSAKDW